MRPIVSALTQTVPVPIWMALLFLLATVVVEYAAAMQTRELRRLFEWYLSARGREPSEEEVNDAN